MKNRLRIYSLFGLLSLSLIPAQFLRAQGADTSMHSISNEVKLLVAAVQADPTKTGQLTNLIVKYLQNGFFVSDTVIIESIKAVVAHEESVPETTYARTLAYIDSLKGFVADRRFLEAWMYSKKGAVLNNLGMKPEAAIAFAESAKISETMAHTVQRIRVPALNSAAEIYLSNKQLKSAEDQFLEVMSYPWYNLTSEPEEFHFFRNEYLRASRGLIESRRGNIVGLKNIFFVPAAHQELSPLLDKAIREAQEKQP